MLIRVICYLFIIISATDYSFSNQGLPMQRPLTVLTPLLLISLRLDILFSASKILFFTFSYRRCKYHTGV